MKRNINLVEINPHSMSAILEGKIEEIYKLTSVDEIYGFIETLFDENAINTVASNRLLGNIKKSRSLGAAQFVVTNSWLKGSGLGV